MYNKLSHFKRMKDITTCIYFLHQKKLKITLVQMKFAQIASIFNFKTPQTDPVDFKEPLAKWQTVK